jgi:phosphohistidine phosphatase
VTAATHVYLVRHARAEATSPSGDGGRALAPGGRAAFEALVRAAAPELGVTRVVASPYLRARQTAEILGAALGVPVSDEPALGAGESEPSEVLRLAARLGPGAALVGHNPELAAAASVAAGRAVELPPGGIVALEPAGGALRVVWVRVP